MPPLSAFFIRVSLIYFVSGVTVGAFILIQKVIPGPTPLQLLLSHREFLLMGWTVQLAMGVAFWILPRFEGGSVWTYTSKRGNEAAALLAFLLLNLGVILSALGPLLGGSELISSMGRVAEAAAVASFAFHAWPRVRPPIA